MEKTNIALIGFMGTGKTTIGQILANALKYQFIDTDHYIEKIMNLSISEIFNQFGEDGFRIQETEILKEILQKDHQVISTGGGLVVKKENCELLLKNCFVVSLQATPQNIYFRIKDNKDRPLLNTAHPQRVIRQLLHKRYKYYKNCHLAIKTDEHNVSNIVKKIIEEYRRSF
ncbi:MAG: shikimate kinase [Eubacteriales bacterium]